MYARSYYPDREEIPKNYSGTAFREAPKEPAESEATVEASARQSAEPPKKEIKNPWELPPPKKPPGGLLSFLLGGAPLNIGEMLPHLFKRKEVPERELGTQELLILGVAAILFFSKSGDKLFALLLLSLLFIY